MQGKESILKSLFTCLLFTYYQIIIEHLHDYPQRHLGLVKEMVCKPRIRILGD